jgi:hypothetical protein
MAQPPATTLGQLLQSARKSAFMSVDHLAQCAHGKATLRPNVLITYRQVKVQIIAIESDQPSLLHGLEEYAFWESVFQCLQDNNANPNLLGQLIAAVLNRALPQILKGAPPMTLPPFIVPLNAHPTITDPPDSDNPPDDPDAPFPDDSDQAV